MGSDFLACPICFSKDVENVQDNNGEVLNDEYYECSDCGFTFN